MPKDFSKLVSDRRKRKRKKFFVRLVNYVRYSEPAPRRAGGLQDCMEEGGELLWRGEKPNPYTFRDKALGEYFRTGSKRFSEPFVLRLPGGRALGSRGDVVTPGGVVFTDVCPSMAYPRDRHHACEYGRVPTPEAFDGRLLVLSSMVPRNYFHWLADGFARLRFIREAGVEFDAIYSNTERGFQQNFLDRAGFGGVPVLAARNDSHIVASEIIATSMPGDDAASTYTASKDAGTYRFIQESLLGADAEQDPVDILYVQRVGRRVLKNEGALIEALSNLGQVQVKRMELLSNAEQIASFRGAKVIVSVHGAGLVNELFCRDDALLVEIGNPNYRNDLFFQIAQSIGLEYRLVVGRPVHAKAIDDVYGDLTVDVDEVVSVVRSR